MKDALPVFFVSYDGEGIKNADTIGLSISFCLQQKKVYKKALKEAKIKLEYRSLESNLGRLRESQVS